MDLGWLDLCLRVSDVCASRAFYEAFGFHRVEGDDSQGWAVMVNGEARIGLFAPGHMEEDPVSLNFRGGDVASCVAELERRGIHPARGPLSDAKSGSSAWYRDPDGHLLFLDSAPGEVKKV